MAVQSSRAATAFSSSSSSRPLRPYHHIHLHHNHPKRQQLRQTAASAASGSLGAAFPQDDAPQQAAALMAAPMGAAFPATVFNLVNVIMGAGYVSIPYACRQGGWAALAVLWLLGAVFCYTGNTILQCCELLDKRRQQQQQQQQLQQYPKQQQQQQQQPHEKDPPIGQPSSSSSSNGVAASPNPPAPAPAAAAVPPAGYEDVAEAAFGRLGRLLVSGVMYAELLGICCVYVVLEAEALSTLLGPTPLGAWLVGACGGQASTAFVAAASALILPTVLMPSVEALAALGAIGVMAAVTVGVVVAGLFSGTPAALTGLGDTQLVQLATLPQVLGILAFVYAGHSTFPVIQQSMAAPGLGRRAVTLGYAATAAICSLIGAAGYALWGPATEQVVTANLAAGSLLALLLTALTAANPFSAFAVTLEPVALVLQRRLWGRRQQQQLQKQQGGDSSSSDGQVPYPVRAAIRLGLALACCLTAALLPYVTDLMAFVGALLTMSISLMLPALMHLALFRGRGARDTQGIGVQAGGGGDGGTSSTGSPSSSSSSSSSSSGAHPLLLLLDVGVVLLGVGCAYVGASSAAASLQQKLCVAV